MSDNIPFEIQAEIIKKLPIKPLIQFRSVSKTWKSLIDSSKFITEYQQNTQLQQHILVRDFYKHNYVSFVDNATFPHERVSLTVPESVTKLNEQPIVGCSQGLFCFYNYYAGMYNTKKAIIWNPTIRKSVDVVVPNVLDLGFKDTVIGFGVCPRTLDPILVKIFIKSSGRPGIKINAPWLVEVFRLSLGVWKSLSVDLTRRSIVLGRGQVVIDKFIYFHGFDEISGCDRIMSFDMTSEEFKEIRLPDSLLGVNAETATGLTIGMLKESLVVLQFNCDTDFCRNFGVWMMGNGDPKSFENIYTITCNMPDALLKSVLEFNRNGDPIVEMTKVLDEEEEEYELFVYEPNSQHVNQLGISAKRSSFFVSSYTETLLLLDH